MKRGMPLVLLFLLENPLAAVEEPGGGFIRGDSNLDGHVDLADALRVFGFLFLGGALPPCLDALDVDDGGSVEITDGIKLLGYLFLGGRPIPPPFPGAGPDPTPDLLTCRAKEPAAPDPRLVLTEARVTLPAEPGSNRLSVKLDAQKSAESDLGGSFRLRLGPGALFPFVTVEALNFQGGSLKAGARGESGRITLRRSYLEEAKGAFDPLTGDLQAGLLMEVAYLAGGVKPFLVKAVFAGQAAGGAIQGRMSLSLPPDAPVLGGLGLTLSFTGPWSLDGVSLDPLLELGQVHRLKVGVVADDAAGTNAVMTREDVAEVLQAVNSFWNPYCIGFLCYPDSPSWFSFLPADAMKGGDGDLFHVDDATGWVITAPEELQYLWDYGPDPEKIEVVFTRSFVNSKGRATTTQGLTRNMGEDDTATVVAVDPLAPNWGEVGRVLAHELGHALGIEDHSTVVGNLMNGNYLDVGYDLTPEQVLEAQNTSPIPYLAPPCWTLRPPKA